MEILQSYRVNKGGQKLRKLTWNQPIVLSVFDTVGEYLHDATRVRAQIIIPTRYFQNMMFFH